MYVLACLPLIISNLVALTYHHLGWLELTLDSQVGSILPGVIAFNVGKQGVRRVIRAIAICLYITAISVVGVAIILHLDANSWLTVLCGGVELRHAVFMG
ncbi:MAG: hypothetical protein AAFY11_12310 [Cyanobacteria bacterium J06641_5]